MLPTPMPRRALLIFADDAKLDLARRGLPVAALPLLQFPSFRHEPPVAADIHVFSSTARPSRGAVRFHRQCGAGFAERLENAIATVSALGYDEIVAIGRDCPSLSAADISEAFEQLKDKQLVLGPDHRGGCYLIAFRARDWALLRNICWKRNTDCAQLRTRCGESAIHLLEIKHDIDSWADVRFLARSDDCVARLADFLIETVLVISHEITVFVHAAARFIRVHGQLPPPLAAA